MKAIFGLGNPGKQYQNTRHNLGYLVLDALAKHWGVTFKKYPSLNAEVAEAKEDNEVVWLIKPHTYMNASGQCIAKFLKESGLSPLRFLVIVDDIHLPFGAMRYRDKGSDGGHNGLKSIEEQIHTTEYARLRCGVGQPEHEHLKDYVLAEFTAEEKNTLPRILKTSSEAARMWILKPLEVNSWLGRQKNEEREQTDLA